MHFSVIRRDQIRLKSLVYCLCFNYAKAHLKNGRFHSEVFLHQRGSCIPPFYFIFLIVSSLLRSQGACWSLSQLGDCKKYTPETVGSSLQGST